MINTYKSYSDEYHKLRKGFLSKMFGKNTNSLTEDEFEESVEEYLDSLEYESIYDRELEKIIMDLPNICFTNISSKKILNQNVVDLIDLTEEYIEVD
jgi:hypothetical protein